MTLHGIAERLHLGSAGHVSHLFYRKGANASEVSGEGCQYKLFCHGHARGVGRRWALQPRGTFALAETCSGCYRPRRPARAFGPH